jgi:hypothetical protein
MKKAKNTAFSFLTVGLSLFVLPFNACGGGRSLSNPYVTAEAKQSATTFSYAQSKDVISNPERGLYAYADEVDHSGGKCWWGVESKYQGFLGAMDAAKGDYRSTLVYLQYDLGAYRTAPIPKSYFDCMDRDFAEAKRRGFKFILRFAYNRRKLANGTEYDDYGQNQCATPHSEANACEATVAQVLTHLRQQEFVDFITRNAATICVWQAGFLGEYGEWYYTAAEIGIQDKFDIKARLPILKQMLEMLPSPGVLQVRTPFYKEYAIRELIAENNPSLADDVQKRVGMFDDGFYDRVNECNTYHDKALPEPDSHWQDYEMKDQKVPVGGETCSGVTPKLLEERTIQPVIDEFIKYHWSFFSAAKLTDGLDWTALTKDPQNRLQTQLGYRLWLAKAAFAEAVPKGTDLKINVDINNAGMAPPFKGRAVRFVLCASDKCAGKFDAVGNADQPVDVRNWITGGPYALTGSVHTGTLAPGSYYLFLQIADLGTDTPYAAFNIQLANDKDATTAAGTRFQDAFSWDADGGLNRFGKIKID